MLIYFLIYGGILFVFGLCIGSFLNVVIDRLPLGEGLGGRSHADCCGETLGVADLVPVLSYIFYRGKCHYCGQQVSFYYPVIELLAAALTLVAFLYFPIPYSIFYALSFYLLIVFFFTDFKYGLVSFAAFLVGLYLVSISYVIFFLYNLVDFEYLLLTYGFAAISATFFILLILVSRGRGMGLGDVLLAFLFCLICGFPVSVVAIFLSFVFGGLVSVFLLLLKKKRFGQSLPFGPFMVAGSLVAIFYGQNLVLPIVLQV